MSEGMQNIKDDWIWWLQTSGSSANGQGIFEWELFFLSVTDF